MSKYLPSGTRQSVHTTRTKPRALDTTSKLVAGAIGAVAVFLGILAGLFNPFLPNVASRQGSQVDGLFNVTLGIATAVLVVVEGVLLYSIVRFGRQPGDESDGPPIRGHAGLEILWTALPAAIVAFLGIYSYQVLADIERPVGGEIVVEVTALQFAWQFYYPENDLTAAELHIPLDQTVLLKLRSQDVIHSFWVPGFRIKKDVMPDRVTELRVTGTELGAFPVVCAELCGAGHAVMRSQVVVQSDADYRSWLAGRSSTPTTAEAGGVTEPVSRGRALYTQYACNACHILSDANATGQIGPSLDGIATRASTALAGQTAEEYLRSAILRPNETIAAGYQGGVMPQDYSLRMPEEDLQTLVQYLLLQQ